MKSEPNYAQDLAAIRSIMERSSKFLSLSGFAGVLAGIYALAGSFVAWQFFGFRPAEVDGYTSGGDHLRRVLSETGLLSGGGIRWTEIYLTAGIVLVLAILTAALLSTRNARKRGESVWNTASRQLLISMMVPLAAGGLLIVILIQHGLHMHIRYER